MRKVFSAWEFPPKVEAPMDDTVLVDYAAAAETDINRILTRLGVPGMEQLTMETLPAEADQDFTPYRDMDLPAMLRMVDDAHREYDQLPAALRQKFRGLEDFVDVICNPSRIDEAVAAGLFKVSEETGEVQQQPVPPAPLDVSRPTDTGVSDNGANGGV